MRLLRVLRVLVGFVMGIVVGAMAFSKWRWAWLAMGLAGLAVWLLIKRA